MSKPNHRGSYIDSSDWIINRIATINPNDDKYFQCAITIDLDLKKMK